MHRKRERERRRRYRVRAKLQRLSEQSEMIHELRDQMNACLDIPTPERYKKIDEILGILAEVTKENNQLITELQNEIAELRKQRISH